MLTRTTKLRWRRLLAPRGMAILFWLALLALLLPLGGCDLPPPVPPPEPPAPNKQVWLEQNRSAEQRNGFHHASQGTATLPVNCEWFTALEQPEIGFS